MNPSDNCDLSQYNTLNITEEVLRYLLVSVDPKSVKAAEETEEKIETVETEEK